VRVKTGDSVRLWLGGALGREAEQRVPAAALAAVLLAREVRSDSKQPGAGIWPRQVVVGAASEGDDEGLSGQVARELLAGTQGQEAVDERKVALEHRCEDRWLSHRSTDGDRVSWLAGILLIGHYP
jgi:hypothetical protein